MMWMYEAKSLVFTTDDANDGISLGSIFCLDLPFRIATGKTTRFVDKFEHHDSELWVFNRIANYKTGVPIKNKKKREEALLHRCSRIVILLGDRRPNSKYLSKLKQQAIQGETPDLHQKKQNKHTNIALNVVERLLIALYSLYPVSISGPESNFSPMSHPIFHECLTTYVRFLKLGSKPIEADTLWDLSFQRSSFSPSSKWGSLGHERNLTTSQKNRIQKFIKEKLDNHYYYELKYRARSFAHYYDYRSALLWEVIALECVVNDIYHKWFEGRTKSKEVKENKANELCERVGRTLQLSGMLQFLCFVLLPLSLRPPVELVERALKATLIRNKITHSLRTKDGSFHSKKLTTNELTEGRKAIIELTTFLIRLAEKSLNKGINADGKKRCSVGV